MRLAAAFAPSQDVRDRFFSTSPTSLGWALAPLIAAIDSGELIDWSYSDKILDPLRVTAETEAQIKEYLTTERPDVLLLSSTYDSHNEARRIAATAKGLNSELLVIYGGPHVDEVTAPPVVACMPQVFPFSEPECPFDILVAGDGEMVLTELLRLYGALGSREIMLQKLHAGDLRGWVGGAPGRWRVYTSDGGPCPVAASNTVLPLSNLPSIPRKMFCSNMNLYGFACFYEESSGGGRILLPSTSTMLHRGCSSHCIFCSERGGYAERSVEHLTKEIEYLLQSGYRGVFFDDSTLSDQDLAPVLPILRTSGLQYASLNRFDKLQSARDVAQLAQAGFVYQYCAIEQLDDKVLRAAGKGQSVKQIELSARLLAEHGLKLGVSLLFGLQFETRESVLTTLDFVSQLAQLGLLSCVGMSLYSYHPNTPQALRSKEAREVHGRIRFDQTPPNFGLPWSAFEEGQWWHRPGITEDWVGWILEEAEKRIPHLLVRNMTKQGEFAEILSCNGDAASSTSSKPGGRQAVGALPAQGSQDVGRFGSFARRFNHEVVRN